jgi:hypothetical protein
VAGVGVAVPAGASGFRAVVGGDFARDTYDRGVQVLALVESLRDGVGGLTDLYRTLPSNRMNEIMKVLTIIGTIFIPLTFVAGIYGISFEYMPELAGRYGYPAMVEGNGSNRRRPALPFSSKRVGLTADGLSFQEDFLIRVHFFRERSRFLVPADDARSRQGPNARMELIRRAGARPARHGWR